MLIGRDRDDEHRGFSGFSLWPTKWQASIPPVRLHNFSRGQIAAGRMDHPPDAFDQRGAFAGVVNAVSSVSTMNTASNVAGSVALAFALTL